MGKTKTKKNKETVRCEVNRLGASILETEEFQRAYDEIHHKATSVASHSMDVACTGVRICRILNKFNVKVNREDMVKSALCHDLGMLERNDRYATTKECHRLHPEESAKLAEVLISDYNENIDDAIRNHMWPMAGSRPKSREGKVITVADKYCAFKDVRHIVRTYGINIISFIMLRGM
ncbi:MAG: HD domain-containing protein [Lachnospiraceae bacterium]|nr:HD domain-containing protein [Lachnospiraceae bacterium]